MLGGLVKSLQCYQHSNRAPSPDAWDTRFFGAPLHLLLLRHQSGIAESSDHRWNLLSMMSVSSLSPTIRHLLGSSPNWLAMHLNMKLLGFPTTWAWRCAAVSTAFKRQPVPTIKHKISQYVVLFVSLFYNRRVKSHLGQLCPPQEEVWCLYWCPQTDTRHCTGTVKLCSASCN